MFLVLKIIKNWHFLTPLPPTSDYVIYEWSLSGGGTSIAMQSSQKNDPVYDLDLSSKVHLKWQVDYENDEVIFEVAFLDKNHQGIHTIRKC